MIKMNNVFAYADKDNTIISLMWMFPYKVFKSFKEIYVLTYMFDGQIQKDTLITLEQHIHNGMLKIIGLHQYLRYMIILKQNL